MTIRASFASEETIGVSGNDRQHGITETISELVEESDRNVVLNVLGVQGCGATGSEEGASTVLIVRLIEKDDDNGMKVSAIAVLTSMGCVIESIDEQLGNLMYTAVEMYGIRSGDNSIISHDSRPKSEDEK